MKYEFEGAFSREHQARILAAIRPLDELIRALDEAIVDEYHDTEIVWYIRRDARVHEEESTDPFTVQVENSVVDMNLWGTDIDHLVEQIERVRETISTFSAQE